MRYEVLLGYIGEQHMDVTANSGYVDVVTPDQNRFGEWEAHLVIYGNALDLFMTGKTVPFHVKCKNGTALEGKAVFRDCYPTASPKTTECTFLGTGELKITPS